MVPPGLWASTDACSGPVVLFVGPCFRHRVDVQVEWLPVAHIEHALLVPAFQGVRRVPRQADKGRAGYLLTCSISSHVGEVTLEPHIGFVAGVAMVGNDILRRSSKKD